MKFYKENKINPAASCLPIVLPDPDLHLALLRPARLRRATCCRTTAAPSTGSASSTSPRTSAHGRLGPAAARHLRRRASCRRRYFMSTTMQGAQRILLMVLPVALRPVHPQLPGRPDALLADDEPVDDRPGPRDAAADARSPRRPRSAARARPRRTSRRPTPPPRRRSRRSPRRPPPARAVAGPPRRVKRKRAAEATGDERRASLGRGDRRDGRRGEVERRCASSSAASRASTATPSASRSSREGERGLLGVGYTPAPVIASAAVAGGGRAPRRAATAATTSRARPASSASCSSARSRRSASRRRSRSTEADDELVATLVGDDLGVADRPPRADDRRAAVPRERDLPPDAGRRPQARRRRRGRLSRAARGDARGAARARAEQASATGNRVELEPMTAVERRIVHELLKDDPEVETSSEGTEPNRFVVVLPRRSAD